MDGTEKEEDNPKRDTLLFDLIKRRYDAEWGRIAGLDGKANNFIGFVSVVTGLLLGSSTFTFSKLLSYPSLTVLYFLGTGLLLVSIGFALSAIKIRRWHASNVETLLNKYTSMSYWDAFTTNRDTMADAVLKMEKQNNRKAEYISLSRYLLLAGLVSIFIFMALIAITGANVTKDG